MNHDIRKTYISINEPLASQHLGKQIDVMIERKINTWDRQSGAIDKSPAFPGLVNIAPDYFEKTEPYLASLDSLPGLNPLSSSSDSSPLGLNFPPKFFPNSYPNAMPTNSPHSPKGLRASIIFLCIGSDRATGDSLGPLVGHFLQGIESKYLTVVGSLAAPVHAKNIQATICAIETENPGKMVIAIDACLGDASKVGSVIIENKALSPGAGVEKRLPPVGDISIKGVVNALPSEGLYQALESGSGEEAVGKLHLKNNQASQLAVEETQLAYNSPMDSICSTRLFLVCQMAEMIVQGIFQSQYIQTLMAENKKEASNVSC